MTRYRVTIRSDIPKIELSGYLEDLSVVTYLVGAVKPLGATVVAEPAEDEVAEPAADDAVGEWGWRNGFRWRNGVGERVADG